MRCGDVCEAGCLRIKESLSERGVAVRLIDLRQRRRRVSPRLYSVATASTRDAAFAVIIAHQAVSLAERPAIGAAVPWRHVVVLHAQREERQEEDNDDQAVGGGGLCGAHVFR
jgi:hypothetical protein